MTRRRKNGPRPSPRDISGVISPVHKAGRQLINLCCATPLRAPRCPAPGISGSGGCWAGDARSSRCHHPRDACTGTGVSVCVPPFKPGHPPNHLWARQGSGMPGGLQERVRRPKVVTHPQPPIPDFCGGEHKSSLWMLGSGTGRVQAAPDRHPKVQAAPDGCPEVQAEPHGCPEVQAAPDGRPKVQAAPNGQPKVQAAPNGHLKVQAAPNGCPEPLPIPVPGFATPAKHIWELLT